jgi:LDH2 family malate/lactate/ureidoglycolate dehydrogenase
MEVASECGIGIALTRGSNHFGPISPYAISLLSKVLPA